MKIFHIMVVFVVLLLIFAKWKEKKKILITALYSNTIFFLLSSDFGLKMRCYLSLGVRLFTSWCYLPSQSKVFVKFVWIKSILFTPGECFSHTALNEAPVWKNQKERIFDFMMCTPSYCVWNNIFFSTLLCLVYH